MTAAGKLNSLGLVSAEVAMSEHGTTFVHAGSLRAHIRETLKDHQRSLKIRIQNLHELISRLPNGDGRTELKNELVLISSHSNEYGRVLRKEFSKLREKIGIAERSRRVLRKLASKIRADIRRPQAYAGDRAVTYMQDLNPHGFASGVHEVLWRFVQAQLRDHGVILDSTEWQYFHYSGSPWRGVFSL